MSGPFPQQLTFDTYQTYIETVCIKAVTDKVTDSPTVFTLIIAVVEDLASFQADMEAQGL